MLPNYSTDIDALSVETKITAFSLTDEKDTINNLILANGNKPIMSQRESIELYGHSTDVDKTMQEISEENMQDSFDLTI